MCWICCVITMSWLSGCSSGIKKELSDRPADSERVTIKFYAYGSEEQQAWGKVIASFENKYPAIQVQLVNLSEKGDTLEYAKKLDLTAASGEEMDVVMFSEPGMYAQRVALGMVAPLDAFIAKEGYKVNEEYKIDTMLNGKYYALPGKFNPWYVLLNKDHLHEAGLEVPSDWTWDEFMRYASKLTRDVGGTRRYGTYFHGPRNGSWLEYARLALANQPDNSDYLKADGSSNLDHPLFRKSIEMLYRMEKIDRSSTPYTDAVGQKLHYRPQFFNQSVSMIVIGSWMNSEIGGTEPFPLHFNVAAAPLPKNNKSDPGGYSFVTTDYMGIASNSRHMEEAYQFIRYYTTKGIIAQGKYIPSWSKINDLDQIVDTIVGGTKSPEKVDKASIQAVLAGSKPTRFVAPTTYQADVYRVINEEYEHLILGRQNLDDMIRNAQERTQKIIDSNTAGKSPR